MSTRDLFKTILIVVLGATLLCAGCSKKEDKKEGGDKAEKTEKTTEEKKGAPFHQDVAEALAEAGLKVAEFETAAARPYQAAECVRGEVAKLDVMICRYESEEAAKTGEKKLDQFLGGAVSGAFRRSKTTIFAVADRNKVDLQGKTINKMLKTFEKQQGA
jgi:hypothetical protein